MQLNISFKNLDSSDAVKSYTSEKSDKLKKYFNGRITVTWNFSIERANQIAHCHLVGNNMDYFGEGASDNLYASIDQALDRIEKQLRKHKEIVKNRLHTNGKGEPAEPTEESGE